MKRHNDESMRQHWESRASDYILNRKWSAADDRVLELLCPMDGDSLLEIGIGPGTTAAEIVKAYPGITYVGVDLARGFLRSAREKLPDSIPLILASAASLPVKDECFHHILEMNVIHHFPKSIIRGIVEKIAAILVPGGQYISVEDWAATPKNERERLAYSIRKRLYHTSTGMEYHPTEREWRTMFKNAGLSVERAERVERPLDLERFGELNDPAIIEDLRKLRRLWGNDPATAKMSLFVCRKE